MEVAPTEPLSRELKVWLGFVKLDGKMPSRPALRHLLYNSSLGSAQDADVIALCLTDLDLSHTVMKNRAAEVQHLLKHSLDEPQNYLVNEDDQVYIPAASNGI